MEEDDHQFLKRLKRLGLTPPVSPEKPFCVICDRAGHATENCWYNPNCRGKIPPHIAQRNFQPPAPQANQVMPTNQGRGFNPGQRNPPQRPNWQRPQDQEGQGDQVCEYCSWPGHRIGPNCQLWCRHREERGRPVVRFNEAGRGRGLAPPNQNQAPQANVVLVEMTEFPDMEEEEQDYSSNISSSQVAEVSSSCDPQCDCSSCILIEDCEDSQAMAVT